jgi:hypothetical protein
VTSEQIIFVSWWMIGPLVALGSTLHFLFDWTRHNRFAAIFSAVNESYWEHIKIAIWPVFLLQTVLFASGGFAFPAYVPAMTVALYSIPVSMVGLVFIYKAVAKRNLLWLDIGVFAISITLSQAIFVLLLDQLAASTGMIVLSTLFLVGLIAAFLLFTVRPPSEPDVFIDPINRRYGLGAHPDLDEPRADKSLTS